MKLWIAVKLKVYVKGIFDQFELKIFVSRWKMLDLLFFTCDVVLVRYLLIHFRTTNLLEITYHPLQGKKKISWSILSASYKCYFLYMTLCSLVTPLFWYILNLLLEFFIFFFYLFKLSLQLMNWREKMTVIWNWIEDH